MTDNSTPIPDNPEAPDLENLSPEDLRSMSIEDVAAYVVATRIAYSITAEVVQPPVSEVQAELDLGVAAMAATVDSQPGQFNPRRRRAFGSVPKLLKFESASDQLTIEDHARVAPRHLQEALFTGVGSSVNGLALNSVEYQRILVHKQRLTTKIAARGESTHALSNPVRQAEAKITTVIHVYEDLHDSHMSIITGINKEHDKLVELRRLIHSPGFALTDEADLLIRANDAWNFSFANLLRVVANQRKWTVAQTKAASAAMTDGLIRGPQRQKVQYWDDVSKLADRYALARRALFTQRSSVITTEIKKLQKELQAFYEDNNL